MIESFDMAYYSAIFLVPGFWMCKIIDMANPSAHDNEVAFSIRSLGFSILNFAFCSWISVLLKPMYAQKTWLYWLLLIICSITVSVLVAVFFAVIKHKEFTQKLFALFGINATNSIPYAWDYVFSKPDSMYLAVSLTDGNQIFCYYGEESFTSSEVNSRDIYVEKIFTIDEATGKWIEQPDSSGLLIMGNQIQAIEIIKGA